MHFLFSYIAQPHQTLHSLPIAVELARKYPNIKVHVACTTEKHLTYIKSLVSLYPNTPLQYHLFDLPNVLRQTIDQQGTNAGFKLLTLYLNRNFFKRFSAIIVPERTSLYLKQFGVTEPKLIWTRHGAGDRAIGFAKDIRKFDFILMAGKKIEQRLLQQQSIRSGQYQTGVYAKFDIIHKLREQYQPTLFKNNKPTILYNPHFKRHLSSWHKFGHQILGQFTNQNQYNLIFAPHFRLFYPPSKKDNDSFKVYKQYPHILIDLGSPKSIDMTYTIGADLYLGDVSSQISEFLVKPRPCLFLNAHHAQWEKDENYEAWKLGPVLSSPLNILEEIDKSFFLQKNFLQLQKDYICNTFGTLNSPTAHIGAKAIVDYLQIR
ncbi:CDP-glycerol glycerophosphotransferase [Commensalibacter communis]|uniref:sensor domain-containing protein n=1 Tax=Commensalibacter communis TaxID=2972786 RepID=UPI0022FF676D|nr:sensor domain-containing protein [Commensalibacter communis]CAI3944049.1 CDP-glycerol glycerophosphotransferase [Commensalibacter communis]CAI3945364.1 CDP-glycerol glycerophosphotransferase [Commensalibacter communis]